MTREEAIPILRQIAGSYGDVKKYYDAMWMAIEALQKRKTGKWIVYYECPKCGEITKDFAEYCSFCGADMRGEDNV